MIKKIASIIKKIILSTVFIAVAFVLIFALVLSYGISVKSYENEAVKIDGLYIKLNKKIIFDAENISIKKMNSAPNSQSSADDLHQILGKISWIDRLFEHIQVLNLSVSDQNISLAYSNNVYYVGSKYVEFVSHVNGNGGRYNLKLDQLWLKDYDLRLNGEFFIDPKVKVSSFSGKFSSYGIDGNIEFNVLDDMLEYNFNNIKATSLTKLINMIAKNTKIEPELYEWLTKKLSARKYRVPNLSGKFNLKTLEYYPKQVESIAYIDDLNITFHPSLAPAVSNFSQITLKNGTFYLDFARINYKSIDLNASHVVVENVLETGTRVLVNFKTNSILDANLTQALQAYNIKVPILQRSGITDANVTLDIKLAPYDLKTYGNFYLRDSDIEISGAKFHTDYANIDLNGTRVDIKALKLNMPGTFKSSVFGRVDTRKMIGKFDANLSDILVGTQEILSVPSLKTDITLDFSTPTTRLSLSNPKVNFIFAKGFNSIETADIMPFKKYSKIMQNLQINSGSLHLKTQNFHDFDINLAKISTSFKLLRRKNGTIYNSDDVNLQIKNGKISGETANKNLAFHINKNDMQIALKDVDFILNLGENSGDSKLPNIKFSGQNSRIEIVDFNRTISFDKFNGALHKNALNFSGKIGAGEVNFIKNSKKLEILAHDIKDRTINEILGRDSFKEGNYSVRIYGVDGDHLNGEIHAKNAYLSDFVFYHGLLTFINSVPSLLSFKRPDFNKKGFTIKNGEFEFAKNYNFITLKNIDLVGPSADIMGHGGVDLKTHKIVVDLKLKYLKDASAMIGYLPFVSQIILGDKKEISTQIQIRGSIDKPEFNTQITQDIITSPFKILLNILELPINIFK